MPNVTLITGNDGSNSLQGTAGPDLIYGYDPNGAQSQASAIIATRVATGLNQPVGDGGGTGNPLHSGQDIHTLLAKILRIDVHSDAFPSDPTRNYAVPADNPFVGTDGADEIFAFGLRNPWRPSFDRGLGDLYIADVGQDRREEIDIGQKGANYGWNAFEGPDPFPGGDPVNNAGPLVSPIYSYDHTVGHSITGGYVYRGEGEALQGQYFFADLHSSEGLYPALRRQLVGGYRSHGSDHDRFRRDQRSIVLRRRRAR